MLLQNTSHETGEIVDPAVSVDTGRTVRGGRVAGEGGGEGPRRGARLIAKAGDCTQQGVLFKLQHVDLTQRFLKGVQVELWVLGADCFR